CRHMFRKTPVLADRAASLLWPRTRRSARIGDRPGARLTATRLHSDFLGDELIMQSAATNRALDPTRYFDHVATDDDLPRHDPVCLYLETTNRCNLLCTTCPRTYEELEPPADMGWELFTSIVDQIPHLQ